MMVPLVLCYHALSPTWEADLSIAPDAFQHQIEFFLRRGWHPATFTQAVLGPPRRKTLAITFDDAFASVKRYAAPVLERHGAPATVFAPTTFMSGSGPLTWEGIDHWRESGDAGELEAMNWTDLAALAEQGWEIGSHTRTHPKLTQLSDPELMDELADSRQQCSEALGCECTTIAYPYGDVDARVARAAERTGYLAGAALSSQLTRLGPHRQPRVGVYHVDVGWRFRLKASGPVRALRASPLWPGARA
jgi:peptidoglycan/xylan/chitin deacetylase (PgdA/CDA1 family)